MPCPEKFIETLDMFDVDRSVTEEINGGFDGISSKSPKKLKAEYFARAIGIMENRLDAETTRAILEFNACCKSGARKKASGDFARQNDGLSLEAKLELISNAENMNMGRPRLDEDGTIILNAVSYWVNGKFNCACSNFNKLKRDYPVSKTYCFCCAGHFKYHYEIMLGQKLITAEIVSSPLDSDGKNPCVIRFALGERI